MKEYEKQAEIDALRFDVCFIADRDINLSFTIKRRLSFLISEYSTQENQTNCCAIFGGTFNKTVIDLILSYREENTFNYKCRFTAVMPRYMRDTLSHVAYDDHLYDTYVFFDEFVEGGLDLNATYDMDKWMIDRSNTVVIYPQGEESSSYSAYLYAKSKDKNIIDLREKISI